MDRLLNSYLVSDGQNYDYYPDRDTPNASYVFDDPFADRASDMPAQIKGYTLNNTYYQDLGIVYRLVSGHVYNASRGQPVYIKVYVETWNFEAIRRPINGEYQIMTGDSLRFVVSSITDLLTTDHFEVAFAVTEVNVDTATGIMTDTSSVSVRIPFVSEGYDPESVVYTGTNSAFAGTLKSGHQYVLYMDDEAVAEAGRNGTSTGEFYLGNAAPEAGGAYRENIITRTQAYYEYEHPTITQIDLGYGFGTENNAIYVVNPLNPNFSLTDGMSVGAIGTYNTEYETELTGAAGFTATLNWISTNIPSSYLGGGVLRDWTVRITLTNEADPDFSYEQEFALMMVFTDMSPLDYISGDAGDVLISSVRTEYNESSYLGEYNPYADVYMRDLVGNVVESTGKNVLETAVDVLGIRDTRITYRVNAWDGRVYTSQGINTRYSSSVTIFGNVYSTNIVERRWSVNGYKIEDFALTYNLMINGAERQLIILNPLEPGSYSIPIDSATVVANNIPATATYELIWWDETNQGAFVANGDWLGGGVVSDWTARILVSDGGSVIYAETVTIAVAFLDVLPLPSNRYIQSGVLGAVSNPKTTYAADTYSSDNPYGTYYAAVSSTGEALYTMLTMRANSSDVNMASKTYYFLITEWDTDGVSVSADVYAGNNSSGTLIGAYSTDAFSRG